MKEAYYQKAIRRFWNKVEKTPNCWLWKGTKSEGYGIFSLGKKLVKAHRFCYELSGKQIPNALVLHHTCENPSCVNPKHLLPVTQSKHALDLSPNFLAFKHKRATHCKRGHEFSKDNTRITKTGGRRCRQCDRENVDKKRERKRRERIAAG